MGGSPKHLESKSLSIGLKKCAIDYTGQKWATGYKHVLDWSFSISHKAESKYVAYYRMEGARDEGEADMRAREFCRSSEDGQVQRMKAYPFIHDERLS